MGKKRPGSKKHAPLPQKISNKMGGITTATAMAKKTTKQKPKGIFPLFHTVHLFFKKFFNNFTFSLCF